MDLQGTLNSKGSDGGGTGGVGGGGGGFRIGGGGGSGRGGGGGCSRRTAATPVVLHCTSNDRDICVRAQTQHKMTSHSVALPTLTATKKQQKQHKRRHMGVALRIHKAQHTKASHRYSCTTLRIHKAQHTKASHGYVALHTTSEPPQSRA
jgi:hypothetical protein